MSYQTVAFLAEDGLTVSGDEYVVDNPKGYILLCHRSHFNRGEYREIAPKLNKLGYSCLAIDQRSGMQVIGVVNETYKRAKEQGLATGYVAAKPDIEAAIDYAYTKNNDQPIILVGSSYSASLALLIAAEDNKKLAAVVAFSPGEYLKRMTLADKILNLNIPTLVLSAKSEIDATQSLLQAGDTRVISQYIPRSEGAHGARALWAKTEGHEEYWQAFQAFLKKISIQ
jgi:alpha-beta hydrolase superfamily lysophospholipase